MTEIGDNVIVLFKSSDEVRRDQREFATSSSTSWKQIHADYKLIKAAIFDDEDTLAKAADTALAKCEARRLLKAAEAGTGSASSIDHSQHLVALQAEKVKLRAEGSLIAETLSKIRSWIIDYNRKMDEIALLQKRAERFTAMLERRR